MHINYKIPCALAILTVAMFGCASHEIKEQSAKPNSLPKLAQTKVLIPVASHHISGQQQQDRLGLQIDVDQGVMFAASAQGEVSAYRGKKELWQRNVSKEHGLSAGVRAAEGALIVANSKGQLMALDQVSGQTIWTTQLGASVLAPSLIQSGRVITIANNGTLYAHNLTTGQQMWAYSLPNVQFSLRGQAAPVSLDDRTVLIAGADAYVYAVDIVTGVPKMQRRVAINEGRSDIQRLNDLDGEPVLVHGRILITTSYQGQVTALDLMSQRVLWSNDASSTQRPEVYDDKVFVSTSQGRLLAFDLMSGQVLWENEQLLNRQLSNPVALGADIIVGDYDGVLHIIPATTGQVTGRSKSKGQISTLRVLDGKLYVMSDKGQLTVWQNR